MGDIKIKEAKNIEKLRISELSNIDPLVISEVRHIAPAAVHIKELNHIDPISVESLRVNEVRNLDPIRVEKFNVTNLPTVNLSLRQLPGVDLNVRRLPPVSVGLHQEFCLPSSYTLRGKLLGIELFRINIDGHTVLTPRDRARREQSRSLHRSFPEVATAGNPAIPSKVSTMSSKVVMPCAPHPHEPIGQSTHHRSGTGMAHAAAHATAGRTATGPMPGGAARYHGGLYVGDPANRFSMASSVTAVETGFSSVSGGE